MARRKERGRTQGEMRLERKGGTQPCQLNHAKDGIF